MAACGFQPIYSQKNTGPVDVTQNIHIVTSQNRNHQILTNQLSELLNIYGRPARAEYKLLSAVEVTSSSIGQQDDSTTIRKTSKVSVKFTLVGQGRNADVNETFTLRHMSSFSETQNSYATYVSENDAIKSSLSEIAQSAKLRIALILRGRN